MKLWQGRFSKETDPGVNDFNASLPFDRRMANEDITGSIAHVTMLGRCGILDAAEADLIAKTLAAIRDEVANGTLVPSGAEDIHTWVEQTLTERIGDAGKRLHTARSRNDQVALDIRLWLRGQIRGLTGEVLTLIGILADLAEQHTDTVMPGYTHLQRAQPVTLAHYLLAYAQMLRRDVGRLDDAACRMNLLPLGAGALAGTTYPIDRSVTAELLGFDGVTENSMDSVSDRDFVIETASALSILMMHLSRFSEEIILWCSSEFSFIELDDGFSTGSSIMPQKKNPDVAELVRGKTGRVYGSLVTLLTVMKGIPLAYNKDMQEDKEAIFDAMDNARLAVTVFGGMIRTMNVKKDVMREAAEGGYMNATDCADYLTRRGLPFRDAYKITGELVRYAIRVKKPLSRLTLDEYRSFSPLFDETVFEAIDLDTCVNGRKVTGGPARDAVKEQLAHLRAFLADRA